MGHIANLVLISVVKELRIRLSGLRL